MMRHKFLIIALLSAGPAAAWEFSPTPICTLSHSADTARAEITYDPATALYTLTLTRNAGAWAQSPRFGMAFTGGVALTIGTAEHRIDGPRLSVADTGFGNVLNGLEFNAQVTGFTDSDAVTLPLAGAQEPVRAFRACAQTPPATS